VRRTSFSVRLMIFVVSPRDHVPAVSEITGVIRDVRPVRNIRGHGDCGNDQRCRLCFEPFERGRGEFQPLSLVPSSGCRLDEGLIKPKRRRRPFRFSSFTSAVVHR
jgi:hypothetical protein